MLVELFYQGAQTERGLDPARRRSERFCSRADRPGCALSLVAERRPAIPVVSYGRGYARFTSAFHRQDGSRRLRNWNGTGRKFTAQGVTRVIQSPAAGW